MTEQEFSTPDEVDVDLVLARQESGGSLRKVLAFNLCFVGFALLLTGMYSNQWLFHKGWVSISDFPSIPYSTATEFYNESTSQVMVVKSLGLWESCVHQVDMVSEFCTFGVPSRYSVLARVFLVFSVSFLAGPIVLVIVFGSHSDSRSAVLGAVALASSLASAVGIGSYLFGHFNVGSGSSTYGLGLSLITTIVGSFLPLCGFAVLLFDLSTWRLSLLFPRACLKSLIEHDL